jgi:hypothetical protein
MPSPIPSPASEESIRETETALKIKFPPSYREKMLKENGGELKLKEGAFHLIPVRASGLEAGAKTAGHDVVSATKEQKKNYTFPNDGIAFAANDAGDHLVFVKEYYHSDKLKNGVFLWNKKIGFVKRVAEDFSKLL